MDTILLIDGENMKGKIKDVFKEAGKETLVFREKGVDVKVAVDMVSLSCDKKVKEIILCSSDSDLQPAIEEVRKRKVNCVYVGFEVNPNKGLFYTTKRTILIRNSEVMDFERIQNKLI